MDTKHEKHNEPVIRQIMIRLLNAGDKEKNLKTSQRKKEVLCRGTKIRMTADFSQKAT